MGLGVLFGGMVVVAPAHAGVQTSGSNSILPSDSTLEIEQNITLAVRITNTSSNTNPPNEDSVPAVLFGTTKVFLACTDSTCAVPLPNTLVVTGACTDLAAGVASCALDPGDPTGNTVLITMTAGGVAIGAGGTVTLARIPVQATTPVNPPADGRFNTRASRRVVRTRSCRAIRRW
jgi:hypothetical protein